MRVDETQVSMLDGELLTTRIWRPAGGGRYPVVLERRYTLDEVVVGRRNRLWWEYLTHQTFDSYWRVISVREKLERISIPVYVMGGWYDNYPTTT